MDSDLVSKTESAILSASEHGYRGQGSNLAPDKHHQGTQFMDFLRQARNKRIREKQLALRAQLFPQVKAEDLWDRRVHTGFATVPRTMPLVMRIMDIMSKGEPVSATYFDLWCRAFDDAFISLKGAPEMAFSSGFSGQRAVQTWKKRIGILAELGFIKLAAGSGGTASYALILNPHKVILGHRKDATATLAGDAYNALVERAIEVGAEDFVKVR